MQPYKITIAHLQIGRDDISSNSTNFAVYYKETGASPLSGRTTCEQEPSILATRVLSC